jgi:hypothetical protein
MKDTITTLKRKGFNYIKVEAEIRCGKENRDKLIKKACQKCNRGTIKCPDCNGNRHDCEKCNGLARVECPACQGIGCSECYDTGSVTCGNCLGEGSTGCPSCNGSGKIDCLECHGDYQEKRAKKKTINCSGLTELLKRKLISKGFKFDDQNIAYSTVYNDPSVDTEWTFTIHVNLAERLPEFISLFKATLKPYTDIWDESNAGLHISVFSTPNPNDSLLDEKKLQTFQKHAKNVRMGLYATGTPNSYTRPLDFRKSQISDDDKYSAIFTHGKRYFEFRVFDPCFSEPKRILKYVKIIGNMMKFYGIRSTIATKPYTGNMLMKAGPRAESSNRCRRNEDRRFRDLVETSEGKERLKEEIGMLLGRKSIRTEWKKLQMED